MTASAPPRADPDSLLARVRADDARRDRGRLTVFFGAAPGVGKTYAMLEHAAVLRDVEGRDVVVGVVETHGRFETTTLLAGFEIVPLRRVAHGTHTLEELDVEAVVARRPSLVLVDELAHSNAPGSRHAKRWQDVADLLAAGLDVFTTLNVQHVESVGDVVARITGVVVRETVPDAVLDEADAIKLVDLPPDALLARLREGKVYREDRIEPALQGFFRKGNLLALRELALRATAERVDADVRAWKHAHGIERAWAATDRLLVCVGPSPFAPNLVRVTRRMAAALHAPWLAVHVETPRGPRLDASARARLARTLRLAEELGAETATVTGEHAAQAILRLARSEHVTKIVVGKPRVRRLRDRFGRSLVDELLLGSGDIDVYATVGEVDDREEPGARRPVGAAPDPRDPAAGIDLRSLLVAGAAVAASTGAAFALVGRENLPDAVMVYLLGLVVVAARSTFRAAVTASVLAVLAFDFLFVPPYYTFSVSDLRHVVTFGVMLLVAVVISTLTRRVRDQAEAAGRSERRTAILYALARELAAADGAADVARRAVEQLERVFGGQVAIVSRDEAGRPTLLRGSHGLESPVDAEAGALEWVLTRRLEAGAGTGTLAGSRGTYVPLVASGDGASALGVLALYPADPRRFEDAEQRRLATALARQLAVALARATLAAENDAARTQVEAERLRSTLLSSVSHDLRTPLAVLRGAASTLAQDDPPLEPATRRELVSTLLDETERLERQVRNLLDMTRLESGTLALRAEWQPLQEVLGSAFGRVESRLAGRAVRMDVPPELGAPLDAVLVEQLLVNLLENAAKYTPPGSPLEVRATGVAGGTEVRVEVDDHGPGVPARDRARVFEKFQRGEGAPPAGGIGLGLAICRAIVEAHGGRIGVDERPGGGARFWFTLPAGHAPVSGPLPELDAA